MKLSLSFYGGRFGRFRFFLSVARKTKMETEIAAEAEAIGIETLVKVSEEALVPPTEGTSPGNSSSIKRKRRELSLGEKVKLIQESTTSGKSHRFLAGVFNIGKTTVHDILKNKDRILNAFKNGDESRARKRIRLRYGNDDINKLTWHWYEHKRSKNLQVTGPNLQAKAREFAEEFDAKDFRASNGWLESFKKRYGIHFGVQETFGLNDNKSWPETVQELTDGYRPNDVYTIQEIGLLFRASPDKTLPQSIGSDLKDTIESSSERCTVLLCCNMNGEFEIPVVVGKSAKSASLDSAPVTWRTNRRAWMTSIIFEKWLHDFDNKIRNEDRHVVLFAGISTAHPPHPQLFNIKLVFFPIKPQPSFPDVHPLNLGITDSFRYNYRKKVLLSMMDKECHEAQHARELFQQIDEVQACKWIASAVNEIPSNKVRKAFEAARFTSPSTSDSLSSYSMAFTALNGDESSQNASGDLYTVYLHDSLPNSVADVSKAVDETEIQLLLNTVLAKLQILHPMTSKEYVSFDAGLQTSDDLSEGWEERLVEDFSDNHDTLPVSEESIKSPVQTSTIVEEPPTPCKKASPRKLVSTYLEAAQLNRHLISFAKDKQDEELLDMLQNVETSIFSKRLVSSYQDAILINRHLISFAQEEKNKELLNQLCSVEKKLKLAETQKEDSNTNTSLNS